MQQVLGIVIVFSTIIYSMVLSGSILMFIDTQAFVISLGIFLAGIKLNTTKETNFRTHLRRVFSNDILTTAEAESSASFYSNLNKFTIAASVVTLIIAALSTLQQFDQPKTLGPIIAITLLVTLYTGIVSTCFIIPAKFKLLSSLPENNLKDSPTSSVFLKATVGTLLINIVLITPWVLGGSLAFLIDLPSLLMIALILLGGLIFVKNIKTKVLSHYLFSFLMTAGLLLYLVGVVAILSYDVDSFNTLLTAFSVASLTVLLAVIIVLPLSLLLNYMLQDIKYTEQHIKLLAENKSFVKSYALITVASSALTLLVLIVHFPK
jgi:hypothetical protein